ncbi:PAQR family membrane homeostasis protein TrhA [Faecalibacter sp. LW9]|uniref:PAQR family membrane homeostasis protein TrhA n=1 Tax=Faecalibacter sp. LW9 TaxID=3103144 RepID=UPI002AFF6793|nr:hemolysin III family protein [Faecalibacter sp. LW9]
MKEHLINVYDPKEERLNVYSHLLGIILSCIGFVFLIQKSIENQDSIQTLSFCIFGLSMIILYTASTLYHSATAPLKRARLKIFDHVSIYLLIAGSYTPFTLVSLKDHEGWIIFFIVWAFACIGIIIKLFFTGRFKVISTLMYVFMGWMIVFTWKDLTTTLSEDGIYWLIAGGISYTVGAVLYSIKKIPFNHAIFHVFVLIGTFCHYISVFFYVK